MDKKVKEVKLKNRYTGEVVHTKEYDNISVSGSTEFIKVYHPENPQRIYLANRLAFDKLDK